MLIGLAVVEQSIDCHSSVFEAPKVQKQVAITLVAVALYSSTVLG